MSDGSPLEIARQFLATIGCADFDACLPLLAEDAVMIFPYSPPGLPKRCEGRAAFETTIRGIFSAIERFAWHDVDLHAAADDPEMVFGTGRSESLTKTGTPYRNQYCFVFRIRHGLIIEYREFFDPLPVLAVFGALLNARA